MSEVRNSITIERGPITVDSVEPNQYNSKKGQAQVRQVLKKTYPAGKGSNSLSDGLFDDGEFGDGESYKEERVTWIPVPLGTTKEQVQARLSQLSNACIQKTYSLSPILSDEQKQAMETGVSSMTMEDYEAKNVKDKDQNDILYHGVKQFTNNAFKSKFVEDIDLRPEELNAVKGAVEVSEKETEKVAQF